MLLHNTYCKVSLKLSKPPSYVHILLLMPINWHLMHTLWHWPYFCPSTILCAYLNSIFEYFADLKNKIIWSVLLFSEIRPCRTDLYSIVTILSSFGNLERVRGDLLISVSLPWLDYHFVPNAHLFAQAQFGSLT